MRQGIVCSLALQASRQTRQLNGEFDHDQLVQANAFSLRLTFQRGMQ